MSRFQSWPENEFARNESEIELDRTVKCSSAVRIGQSGQCGQGRGRKRKGKSVKVVTVVEMGRRVLRVRASARDETHKWRKSVHFTEKAKKSDTCLISNVCMLVC